MIHFIKSVFYQNTLDVIIYISPKVKVIKVMVYVYTNIHSSICPLFIFTLKYNVKTENHTFCQIGVLSLKLAFSPSFKSHKSQLRNDTNQHTTIITRFTVTSFLKQLLFDLPIIFYIEVQCKKKHAITFCQIGDFTNFG